MTPFRVVGLIAAGLFAILFLIRMDVLELLLSGPKSLSASALATTAGRESWMSIFQNHRRIGHSHTRLSPQAGGYELRERVLMRVNTMGMVQDLNLQTRADLLADLLVQNLAGHKFPAGFPSRRAWLHIRVIDSTQAVVFESGAVSNNGAITGNTQQTILAGRDAADNALFRVQYHRRTAQGGTYEVRGWVQRAGGVSTT